MVHENNPESDLAQLEQLARQLKQMDLSEPAVRVVTQIQDRIKTLDADFNRLREQALPARLDQTRFVNVVTHELRIPLTSIKGYTDLLRQGLAGPVTDQQTRFLNVIRSNVDRMSELISDLSDMFHIQSGRLKLLLEKTDLARLIKEVEDSWRPRFAEKEQQFKVHMDPEIPELAIDPVRMKQVLGYLLSNANRFTPEHGQIKLSATQTSSSLRFEIQDNGIGIGSDDQAKLFTPFFRSDEKAVRNQSGWGLSLHVAQLLAQLMGGVIGAASQPGKGSTFWFEVPTHVQPGDGDD